MKAYYERNNYLIDHDINKTFEEILWMDDDAFRQWCTDLRHVVVYCWDILGIPPRVGYNTEEIINQFQDMETFPVKNFIIQDELTGQKDVIRNTQILGNAVNQWFPTMMKVPINYTDDVDNGKSIYDFFAQDELLERFITYTRRHFKRDSFYAYSVPMKVKDTHHYGVLPVAKTGLDWILEFEQHYRHRGEYDYWLCPVDEDKEYSGYNEDIKKRKFLTVNDADVLTLGQNIPLKCQTNTHHKNTNNYHIRIFKLGQKVFPVGFKAWRVSFCQYATNYPPLTAKLIYELYTQPDRQNIVWDPSAGWGGRLLGAMSVRDDREILYLANDPNEDHTIGKQYAGMNASPPWTKYHEVEKFYKKNVKKGGLFPADHNQLEFWQLGSEVMQFDPDFQDFKGRIDLVFTSPPYFQKEAYSEDETQSYKKFSTYETWKNGFLFETLKTAYEWLRPEGHLVWNISDVQFGKEVLPLIHDSISICTGLGFKYIKTWKMTLAQSPGANRIDDEGKVTARYSCRVRSEKGSIHLKYEPCLVFQKYLLISI